MFLLLLFLVFLGVATACWFQGLWSSVITTIIMTLSALIATNYFEPICTAIKEFDVGKGEFFLDFVSLWVLFAVSFGLLRTIGKSCSPNDIVFIKPVELTGRSVLAIWCGWIFTCFTAFTLQTAPLPAAPLGMWENPDQMSFAFMSPEQQWMAFAQRCSYGALSRAKFSDQPGHPEDAQTNVETFDPFSTFAFRAYARRQKAEKELLSE